MIIVLVKFVLIFVIITFALFPLLKGLAKISFMQWEEQIKDVRDFVEKERKNNERN